MRWQLWVLVVLYVLNILAVPLRIGEQRKPMTPAEGVAAIVISALAILLLIAGGTGPR